MMSNTKAASNKGDQPDDLILGVADSIANGEGSQGTLIEGVELTGGDSLPPSAGASVGICDLGELRVPQTGGGNAAEISAPAPVDQIRSDWSLPPGSESANSSASLEGGCPLSSTVFTAAVVPVVTEEGVQLTPGGPQDSDAGASVVINLGGPAVPQTMVVNAEETPAPARDLAGNSGSPSPLDLAGEEEIQGAIILESLAPKLSTDKTDSSKANQDSDESAKANSVLPPPETTVAEAIAMLRARVELLEKENRELKNGGNDAKNDTPSREILESLFESQRTVLESVLSQTIAHTQQMIDAVAKQTADNAAKQVEAAQEIAEVVRRNQADLSESAKDADRQRREADAAKAALREREEEQRATQKSEPAEKNSKADSEERARQVNAQVDREVQRDFPFVFKTPGTGGSAHLPGAFTKDDLQKWREVPVSETDKSFYAKEQRLSQEWDILKKDAFLSKEDRRARTKTLKLESQSLKEEKEQAIGKQFGTRIVIGQETPSWFSKARRFVTEIGGMVSSWGVIAGTAWGATQLVTAGSGIGVSVAAAVAGLVTGTIVTRYVSGMLSGFWGDRVANFGGLFVNVGVLGSAYWLTQVWGMQAGLNAGEKGIVCAVVGGLGWLLGKGMHKLGENTYQNTVKTLYEAAMEAGSWPARLAYTQELYEAIERKQQGKVIFPDSHATFSSATLKGIWNRWLLGRIPRFSWDLSKDENSVDHVKLKLLLATRIAAEKYKKELITGVENDPNAVNSYKTQFKAIEEAMKNIEVRSSLLREINWSGTKLLAFPLGASAIAGVFGGVPLADTLFGLVRPFLP